MTNKQAVVNTTAGRFVIDLRPDLAPNHVGYFIKLAREGAYKGTTFHRVIRMGIIQGGDPLSKDPAKAKLYGTGGLGVLKAEIGGEPATRGAVAAVLQPNKPDSGGAQFFVCVTDQPSLSGKYTVFGRVSEGMDVVQKISEAPATPEGMVNDRIEIVSVEIRDTPPPEPEPFSTETRRCAARLPRGARHLGGPDHHRVLPGQGAGARPRLPAAGRRRRARRHLVSPRREGLRRADRLPRARAGR